MNWGYISIFLILGIIIGAVIVYFYMKSREKTTREIADELYKESESQRKEHIYEVIKNLKESFGSLSLEALKKSTDEFIKLGKTELEGKKGLIDQQLNRMKNELEKVSELVREFDRDREKKFVELATQLKTTNEQTKALRESTITLREALASSKIRGQWGERMAEDVLRIAGFIENVNYLKQKAIEGAGSRPDFTFIMPNNLRLNMDVKFPLNNYIKYIEANSDPEKKQYRNKFLRDIKTKIKEVTTREYINPEQNTVDCVLLFIPNEQIYAFIHEQDSSILDEGIKNRVLICSPITLFAVLAVIRQAVDNFALEQTSREILSLFGVFRKQWDKFIEKMKLLGQRIDQVQVEYQSLTTTRKRQLEKPLGEIESLRTQREIPVALSEDKEKLLPSTTESKKGNEN